MSSTFVSSPEPFSVHASFGGMLIGAFFSVMIFGGFCVQVYWYAFNNRDSKKMRLLVLVLWLLEALHTALVVQGIYEIAVSNFGNQAVFRIYPKSIRATSILSSVVLTIVQSFFLYRIYRLSGRWLLPIICSIGMVARVAFVCLNAAQLFMATDLRDQMRRFGFAVITALSIATATDAVICIAMLYYLRKNKTEFARTEQIINRLIVLALESGAITTLTAVPMLLLYVTLPRNSAWLGFLAILAKVYSVALMTALNSRQTLRSQLHANGQHSSIVMPTLPPSGTSVERKSSMTPRAHRADVDDDIWDSRAKARQQAGTPIEIGVHVTKMQD